MEVKIFKIYCTAYNYTRLLRNNNGDKKWFFPRQIKGGGRTGPMAQIIILEYAKILFNKEGYILN